jgi:hypothetical protein
MPTIDELEDELRSLRAELQELKPVQAEAAEARRVMSRRNLLRAAPVVAVGGALAAMSAGPASAAVGDPVLQGKVNNAGTSTTTLNGGTPWVPGGVNAAEPPALSVSGGILGDWMALEGVEIGSTAGAALFVQGSDLQGLAATFSGAAVPVSHGTSGGGAVLVEAMGPGTGLAVQVTDGLLSPPGGPATVLPGTGISVLTASGDALVATSTDGHAISATMTSTTTTEDAVVVSYAGTSRAMYAESTSTTNINGTITGVNDGHGIGVWGEQRNNTGSGFGVVGVGGSLGRGARLSGGAAALQMLPSTASTHPTTGKVGDFFVDSTARLWFCQKASSGTTGATWKQIA